MRILVVGGGAIGTRHIKNILSLGHEVTLVDPAVPTPEKWGMTPGNAVDWYESLDHATKMGGYDAAVVASPSHLHYGHAKQLLELGVPTFIEKPVATSYALARELDDIAREKGVLAMVGQSYRYHKGILLLKERLSPAMKGKVGYIGRPLMVNYFSGQHLSQWYPDGNYRDRYVSKREEGGGVLLTSATHLLDTIGFLFGCFYELSGVTTNSGTLGIDVADAVVYSGRVGGDLTLFTASSDFLQRHNTHKITVVGTEGECVLDLAYMGVGCSWTFTGKDTNEYIQLGNCGDRYLLEMYDFLEAVLNDEGGNVSPVPISESASILYRIERYTEIV